MHRFFTITFALSCAAMFGVAGCSDDDDDEDTSIAGTGGVSGSGGASGAAGSGGTAGSAGTGGSAAIAEKVTCPASPNAEIVGGGAPPFSFTPATTTISMGQVIAFRNANAAPVVHDAVSGTNSTPDEKWETGDIAGGTSVCMRFNVAGSYPYFCEYHPTSMTGTITVQ
jgi:plastocyanin